MPRADNYATTFSIMGTKTSKLHWLLPHLRVPADIFVDAFGGSGVVGLNRGMRPKLQIYNDLDWELFNFMKQLRDHPLELQRLIERTLYSKNEHTYAHGHYHRMPARIRDRNAAGNLIIEPTPLEQARRTYLLASISYSGTRGAFGYSGRGVLGTRSAAYTFKDRIKGLERVAERLRHFEIHNRPAMELIEMFYEEPKALLYLDPPYMPGSWEIKWTRYKDNMTEKEHEEMLDICLEAKARVAISGYASELYQEKLSDWRCETKDVTVMLDVAHGNVGSKTEMLWLNYNQQGILLEEEEDAGFQSDIFMHMKEDE